MNTSARTSRWLPFDWLSLWLDRPTKRPAKNETWQDEAERALASRRRESLAREHRDAAGIEYFVGRHYRI